jgi:hypothetical protein
MIIKWKGPTQYHPEKGELADGKLYAVPDGVGEQWIEQGMAEAVEEKSKKGKKSPKEE